MKKPGNIGGNEMQIYSVTRLDRTIEKDLLHSSYTLENSYYTNVNWFSKDEIKLFPTAKVFIKCYIRLKGIMSLLKILKTRVIAYCFININFEQNADF